MHIVAIGDIGVVDGMIHIGDEAMFGALVNAFRSRGVDRITGVSSNPVESSARYGIEAVHGLGFGRDRDENEARMPGILSSPLADVVRSADGVVIAGGGNLTSLWPHHVYERAALGRLAASLGKPIVVTGQTIGPELGERDSELVAELLGSAALVGVREPSSLALVRGLGVSAEQTIDDASYLVDDEPARGDYCLVSLASHVGGADRDSVVLSIAALLDGLGMPVRFFAHFGPLDGPSRGDAVMHDRVIAAMHTRADVVAPTTSENAARLARGAALVVSSRYHPVVFAVPAGVPAIGIPVDEYTGVKLSGALGNFGQDGLLPVDELLAGRVPDVRRPEPVDRRAESAAWWDRVARALS